MSGTYAVVEKDLVTNLVMWDGKSKWKPDTGTAVLVNGACGIGWSYDGEEFTQPSESEKSMSQS